MEVDAVTYKGKGKLERKARARKEAKERVAGQMHGNGLVLGPKDGSRKESFPREKENRREKERQKASRKGRVSRRTNSIRIGAGCATGLDIGAMSAQTRTMFVR